MSHIVTYSHNQSLLLLVVAPVVLVAIRQLRAIYMPLTVVRKPRTVRPSIIKRRKSLSTAALATIFFGKQLLGLDKQPPCPLHTSFLTGDLWIDEILTGHPERCKRALGMSAAVFSLLWAELAASGDLYDGRWVTAREQLAIVVYWLVHGSSQRELCERFQRSGDTISRYLNKGLLILTGKFYDKYVHKPTNETPKKIRENDKWYPYFKHCRGATDGVHVLAYVREDDIFRYRDRKGSITQNVLATCDFDMRFVHVMAGYEGTAADGILFDYARLHDGFSLDPRRYYLADAGFPNCDLLRVPYRGVRYHLKEWKQGRQRYISH